MAAGAAIAAQSRSSRRCRMLIPVPPKNRAAVTRRGAVFVCGDCSGRRVAASSSRADDRARLSRAWQAAAGTIGRTLGAVSEIRAVPPTSGVTVELLGSLDLGPEIEGMAGRQLRMRRFTIEPGGVFGPEHDHVGRPGLVYILAGTF